MNNTYQYIRQYGLKNLTIDKLIKYLKISKGGFYHYFKSKDELLVTLFCEISNEYINKNKDTLESTRKTLREKIEVLYAVYLIQSKENRIFLELYKDFFFNLC